MLNVVNPGFRFAMEILSNVVEASILDWWSKLQQLFIETEIIRNKHFHWTFIV